jgi:predicted esterase
VISSLTEFAKTKRKHARHFTAITDPAKSPLVLLHGSGGNEHDLV